MRQSACELMLRYPDLNLTGYRDSWNLRKETRNNLQDPSYDKVVQQIHEFVEFLRERKAILKKPTARCGGSYAWKHQVEIFAASRGEHYWIPNGLMIATLRDLGLPLEPVEDDRLNAKVPFGSKAKRLVSQLLKEIQCAN